MPRTLTFLAAQTKRVLLGTGIIILPQRNPLVLAKELASPDELSEGRLLFFCPKTNEVLTQPA